MSFFKKIFSSDKKETLDKGLEKNDVFDFSKPLSKVCFSCSFKTGSAFDEENIFLKKLI